LTNLIGVELVYMGMIVAAPTIDRWKSDSVRYGFSG
jgi:hypothetical protein